MNRREMIINLALLAAILLFGYLIIRAGLAKRDVERDAREMQTRIAKLSREESQTQPVEPMVVEETVYVVAQDRFPNYGQRVLFDVPIPKPTPSPTPEPTPVPIPPLEQILAQWKLQGVMGTKALVLDQATNETITFQVNGEPYMLNLPPFTFMITMTSAERSRNPTIVLKSDQHAEPFKLQMFPPVEAAPE